MTDQLQRVGELRPNQLLHTYGVGAVADLPNLSVVIAGLDDWDLANADRRRSGRLLAAVQAQLGTQVETLRTPPYNQETTDPFADWARVGVPVRLFPRWLRCSDTRCNRLAPSRAGCSSCSPIQWRPERVRYVHGCRGHGQQPADRGAGPVRRSPASVATWTISRGSTTCTTAWCPPSTGAHASAGRARHHRRGREPLRPVLMRQAAVHGSGVRAGGAGTTSRRAGAGIRTWVPSRAAGLETRTLGLGATNGWFAMRLRVFSLPRAEIDVDQRVAENWGQLTLLSAAAARRSQAKELLPSLACWPDLEPYGVDAVWKAILGERTSRTDDTARRRRPDRARSGRRSPGRTRSTCPTSPPERSRHQAPPGLAAGGRAGPAAARGLRAVRVHPDRRTRMGHHSPPTATGSCRISRGAPTWVPCAQTRGEGIFLRFSEERARRMGAARRRGMNADAY